MQSSHRKSAGTRVSSKTLPDSDTPIAFDALTLLGVSRPAIQILRHFALRPDSRPHGRHLQRVLALSGSQLEREIKALVQLGVLERIADGRLVRYAVTSRSKAWSAVRALMSDRADPGVIVREAMRDVGGIEAAFLFGSTANGTARKDSDVDIFLVENPTLDRRALHRQLHEAAVILGREVNTIRYTPQTLAERLGNRRHPARRFVREVLEGPKLWVAGAASALLPIVTAAGLRIPDLPAK
jgi:predicted nucleotidyltransferase/DNA-binding MarR family transcriptional regulator